MSVSRFLCCGEIEDHELNTVAVFVWSFPPGSSKAHTIAAPRRMQRRTNFSVFIHHAIPYNNKGIGDYTQYPCPVGSYCLEQEEDPDECPAGTYRNNTGATAVEDCRVCPGGFWCAAGSVTPDVSTYIRQ